MTTRRDIANSIFTNVFFFKTFYSPHSYILYIYYIPNPTFANRTSSLFLEPVEYKKAENELESGNYEICKRKADDTILGY